MTKKFLVWISLLIFIVKISIAQTGIDNLWLMGGNGSSNWPVNIDFISGTPNVYTTVRPMNIELTVGAICDTAGNLLFYTNGCYIANSLNSHMYNGDSLNPGSCTQAVCYNGGVIEDGNIIIPAPGNKDIYYLFHETCDYSSPASEPSKLYYSKIDMSHQGGLGEVVQKNQLYIDDALTTGFLSAVKHGNGRDWWIVTHRLTGNIFYTLLLTPNGLQGPFTQAYEPNIPGPWHDEAGQTEFSPDGSKLATSTWWSAYDDQSSGGNGGVIPDLHLFDFDRCTGQFTNHQLIYSNPNNKGGGGGVSFSKNSRFLYLTTLDTILQFDLYASNISQSKVPVAINTDTTKGFWLSQLAYDNKIYITYGNALDLYSFTSINSPDSLGLASDGQLSSIQLPSGCLQTIPNYPNYRLGALTGSACDSLTAGINVSQKQKRYFSVYPNPASTSVTVQYELLENNVREFFLYNLLGSENLKVELDSRQKQKVIDISSLQKGVYYYSVYENKNIIHRGKLILIK
jgi:hypothetical protein